MSTKAEDILNILFADTIIEEIIEDKAVSFKKGSKGVTIHIDSKKVGFAKNMEDARNIARKRIGKVYYE